jgi:UDP-N-acetylglucosamine--N-acetylmuramyl-(pentapeptide) pyrophosphoryl-undecaprenol N-acetylglucosamine transferase
VKDLTLKRVLISAGGGGHTGYAYALAQRLYGEASLSFLVPEGDVLTKERLSRFGHISFLMKPRGAKTPTSEFIPNLVKAFVDSLKRVSGKYDAIVSTGSNFCIPPCFLARLKGVPIVNIESSVRFLKASKTAFILQPFSAITALQWKEQKKLLRRGTVFGPMLPKPEVASRNGGYILVTGGTLGHKKLFDAVSATSLEDVVLQTGLVDPEPYRQKHPKWKVLESSTKFHELVAGAEVVVTHLGSTALEALTYRKPMVIVLNPDWTRTAGGSDGEVFAEKLNDSFIWDVTAENLLRAIEETKKRRLPPIKDGAKNLAEAILSLHR